MQILIGHIFYFIVILLHLYFAFLEIVLWKTKGPKAFGFTREFAESTATLASNQGLYNLFLAAALTLGFVLPNPDTSLAFVLYGLSCVIAAGCWGGMTVNRKIFFIQAVPAILALICYLI